jgi:branched-chain amino acid transport system permease protein
LVGAISGSVLITLLPTIFQPFAIYKTLVTGGLLVLSFLYLPQGLYGAAVQFFVRYGGSRRKFLAPNPVSSKRAP